MWSVSKEEYPLLLWKQPSDRPWIQKLNDQIEWFWDHALSFNVVRFTRYGDRWLAAECDVNYSQVRSGVPRFVGELTG